MKEIKKLLIPPILILLSSCSSGVITDGVGEPYKAKLAISQADNKQNIVLETLVDFGSFGGVPATVTFFSENTAIGSTSERVPLQASVDSPWDYKYSITVPQPVEKHSYYAKVEWLKSSKSMSIVTPTVVFP